MPIPLGILAVAGAGASGGGGYDLLESVILTSNSASVTFSNLNTYSDYKHLQVRIVARDTNSFASTIRDLNMRFNSDSGTNYFGHELIGDPSWPGVFSQNLGNTSRIRARATIDDTATANVFVASIWDILDFSNTSKNKTVRILSGVSLASSANERIVMSSGAWNNTAAITSITITGADLHKSGSRFSLYGVK